MQDNDLELSSDSLLNTVNSMNITSGGQAFEVPVVPPSVPVPPPAGAVAVITRTPLEDCQDKYSDWVLRVTAAVSNQVGFVKIDNVAPNAATHNFWTHIVHFNTNSNLAAWRTCEQCVALMMEIKRYSSDEDVHILREGVQNSMVFGFGTGTAAGGAVETTTNVRSPPTPVAWKQCMVILACIFPVGIFIRILLFLSTVLSVGEKTLPYPIKMMMGFALSVPTLTLVFVPICMQKVGMAKWVFDHSHDPSLEMKYGGGVLLWLSVCLLVTSLALPSGHF